MRKGQALQHPLLLTFTDPALERGFRRFSEVDSRVHLRYALLISLAAWTASMGLAFLVVPDEAPWLAAFVALTTYPFYGFVIFASYRTRFIGHFQWMGFVANASAGLIAIVCCAAFPNADFFTIAVLIFIVLVGGYTLRLRFVVFTLACFIYLGAFQLKLIYASSLSGAEVQMISFIVWITLLSSFGLGYGAERTSRTIFLQHRQIRRQRVQILEEQRKSERLLLNILPPTVAERLKSEPGTIADNCENISVLFADLVEFTAVAESLPPEEVVSLLNGIFCRFDRLVDHHGLEKIKTIGDAYMIAGGLNGHHGDHVAAIASLALDMQREMGVFNDQHGHKLDLRIGIHTGDAVAGVIGVKKFAYDIWGDTVNTAARMESHGLPGKIQASAEMHKLLRDRYHFKRRGRISIKGKGEMETYLLLGPIKDMARKPGSA